MPLKADPLVFEKHRVREVLQRLFGVEMSQVDESSQYVRHHRTIAGRLGQRTRLWKKEAGLRTLIYPSLEFPLRMSGMATTVRPAT